MHWHLNWTAVVAVIGLITTASGPWLTGRVAASNEKRSWQRKLRAETYVEALEYVRAEPARHIDNLLWPYDSKKSTYTGSSVERLSAAIHLHATPPVQQAWQEVVDSDDALRWTAQEDYPGLGSSGHETEGMPATVPEMVRTKAAVEALYKAVTADNL